MLKVSEYSVKGDKVGQMVLPKEFDVKDNLLLLAQAMRVYTDKVHFGLAKAKTRAEVNRTKKKLYKQKGTGGARHGPKSAPIFVGGGVAHGPKLIRKILSLPDKMRKRALWQAISLKVKGSEIVVVDDLGILKKTKKAGELVKKIGGSKFTFVLANDNLSCGKVLGNLRDCKVVKFKDLTAYIIFYGGKIIIDKEIFASKKVTKVGKVASSLAKVTKNEKVLKSKKGTK